MALWTLKDEAALKAAYDENLSYAEIARTLGTKTRNACIGRVRRLGWPVRACDVSRSGRTERPRRQKRVPEPPHKEPGAPTPLPEHEESPRSVTTAQLERHHCKWCLNDGPDWIHCGKHRVEGSPYCAHHREKGLSAEALRKERRAA